MCSVSMNSLSNNINFQGKDFGIKNKAKSIQYRYCGMKELKSLHQKKPNKSFLQKIRDCIYGYKYRVAGMKESRETISQIYNKK